MTIAASPEPRVREPAHADDIRNYVPLDILTPPIRQSNVKTFAICPRMYLLKERCGIVPRGYRRAPEIGQMFHLAMDARYQGRSPAEANNLIDARVQAATEDVLAWAEKTSTVEVADQIVNEMLKDAALAKAMAAIHYEKHPLDLTKYRVVCLEQDLSVQVPELDVPIEGRLDCLLETDHDDVFGSGGYFILDHKTSSRPEKFKSTAGYSTQARIYRILASCALRDRPVLGFIFNTVKTPTITWKSRQTFEEFLDEVRDWYDAKDDTHGSIDPETGETLVFKSGPRKGQPKPRWEHSDLKDSWVLQPPMTSFPVRFTEPLYPDELRNTFAMLSQAATCEPRIDHFPPLGEASLNCEVYNRPCPYLTICSMDRDNWDAIITRHYTLRTLEEQPADVESYLFEAATEETIHA